MLKEFHPQESPPLMRCGHVAMATWDNKSDGKRYWCCVICSFTIKERNISDDKGLNLEENAPDLTGRKARCDSYEHEWGHKGSCGWNSSSSHFWTPKPKDAKLRTCYCETDSSFDLPFFEYQGDGSERSRVMCVCGFHKNWHTNKHPKDPRLIKCLLEEGGFRPRGDLGYDTFYCGCSCGWD